MTATELLPLLDGIRTRGSGKWISRCPSHQDKSPSLTVAEGNRGLLLKCWAGCTLEEITRALHVPVKNLFFDTAGTDSEKHRQAMEQRRQARAKQQAIYREQGLRMDALREAEALIDSASGISIEKWSDEKLNTALDRLGAAYHLLESEAV
jgi:hypothetical protein